VPDVQTLYRQLRVMGVPRGAEAPANGDGHAAPADNPMAEALQRRRQMVADQLEAGTASQLTAQSALDARRLEVEAAKLELEEETARAKVVALRAELQRAQQALEPGGKGDPALGALLQLITQDREQARESQVQFLTLIHEQMEASRQPAGPEPAPSLSIAEQIAQLVQVRQAMAELFPPPAPAPGVNPHQLIELRQMELNMEFQRARLAEESAERVRRLQLEERKALSQLEVAKQQADTDRARNQQMGDLLERLGPAAIAMLQQRLSSSDAPADGGQLESPSTQQQGQQYQQRTCGDCHQDYLIQPDASAAICPHCQVYQQLA